MIYKVAKDFLTCQNVGFLSDSQMKEKRSVCDARPYGVGNIDVPLLESFKACGLPANKERSQKFG